MITVHSTDEPNEALFDKCIGGKVGEGKKPAGHRDDGDAAQVQPQPSHGGVPSISIKFDLILERWGLNETVRAENRSEFSRLQAAELFVSFFYPHIFRSRKSRLRSSQPLKQI